LENHGDVFGFAGVGKEDDHTFVLFQSAINMCFLSV
jgi:hypothetical protein